MWTVAALISLAVLIALVLCVPLDLLLHINMDGKPKSTIRLSWLFGLVSTEIRRRRTEVKHEQKLRDWRGDARAVFEIMRIKGMIRQITRLFKGILSCLRIRQLVVDLKVGLDNPADTGLLFVFMAPISLLVSSLLPHQIRVEPLFAGDTFIKGYLYGVLRMQPIQLVAPVLGFAFSVPAIRALKTLVSSKWKVKR